MPRITDLVLVHRSDQPKLFIRTTTSVHELPRLIGDSYGKLAHYMEELDALPADIPYVAYYNMDMEHLDVEMGFPVHQIYPGSGVIKTGVQKGGKAVFCIYLGPYPQMAPTYQEMMQWIQDHDEQPDGTSFEYYYNGPEYPEEQLLTKILMPLL